MSSGIIQIERVTPEYFTLEIQRGGPSIRSLCGSVLSHATVIALLMTVRFPPTGPRTAEEAGLSPTEIRIDNHLYYVADISRLSSTAPSVGARAPRALAAGAAGVQRPALPYRAASPPKPAIENTPAPAPEPAPAAPAPPAPPKPRQLARTFVPPDVRKDPNSERTLIQPLSPPDLIPKDQPVPSFRVSTAALPRIPRRFVAPGRPDPVPLREVAPVEPAPIELVQAQPAPSLIQPKLTLPAATPPPTSAPKTVETPPPAPAGDPVNIVSLDTRNVPIQERVTVPAGNIAQDSGPETPSGTGAAAGRGTAGSAAGSGTAASSSTPAANSGSAGAPSPNAANSSGGSGNVAQSGTNQASQGNAAIASAAPVNATGTGIGRTPGAGSGSATAGASGSGSPVVIVGGGGNSSASGPAGTTGNASTGGVVVIGGGTGGRAAPGGVITQSPNGSYDAVVVQTSVLDQFPESRGLLSGRPIYSVYISAGGARDWTLYFCVPNEKTPASNSPVVNLGNLGVPVKAPYPTKMLRPAAALPSWERYVLVHGYITAEGHFEEARVVRAIQPQTDKAILSSLNAWEFRPATRDGAPLRVEFLLSIPAKGL